MTCKWGLHDICIPSHCIRSKYSVLHDITWHCIALHDMSVPYVTHITLHGLTLHCIATHYIALQYIASHGIPYHVKTWCYVPFCFIAVAYMTSCFLWLRYIHCVHCKHFIHYLALDQFASLYTSNLTWLWVTSLFSIGKSTISRQFSIAMLVYQRVSIWT